MRKNNLYFVLSILVELPLFAQHVISTENDANQKSPTAHTNAVLEIRGEDWGVIPPAAENSTKFPLYDASETDDATDDADLEGAIIFDKEDSIFYTYDGEKWVSPWEEYLKTPTGENISSFSNSGSGIDAYTYQCSDGNNCNGSGRHTLSFSTSVLNNANITQSADKKALHNETGYYEIHAKVFFGSDDDNDGNIPPLIFGESNNVSVAINQGTTELARRTEGNNTSSFIATKGISLVYTTRLTAGSNINVSISTERDDDDNQFGADATNRFIVLPDDKAYLTVLTLIRKDKI